MTDTITGERLGVPASSDSHGSLGWSSTLVLCTPDDVVILDTGGPGYRAMWDAWLGASNRSRDDVSTVYLTHSHWDHIGSAAWFPRATYVLGREEIDWARGAGRSNPYVEPFLLEGLLATGRVHDARGDEQIGQVRVIRSPGHTPGHLSYEVRSGAGDPVIFVGDAVKNRAELFGGEFAISEDVAASESTRDELRERWSAGASLVFGHDGWLFPDGTMRVARAGIQLLADASIEVAGP
jgi:glyoxylase-like metal-dependent hydrolase (beta-lactamase superfamily II)